MKLTDFLKLPQIAAERVQIFIDGSNLYHALRNECPGSGLDYGEFSRLICNGRKLIRTNYYISMIDAARDEEKAKSQQRFMNALRQVPYLTVSHRPLRYTPDDIPFEKGVDILIATDMLTGALRDCYDTAILVSGDGDFAPVLDEIKRAGKQVENACFQSSRSDALVNAADLFIELSKTDISKNNGFRK
jgi:uncharacterized LabA/DUF88 family protein